MDQLVNRPNHILKNQQLYQSQAALPSFLRGPRGGVYFKAYLGLFAVGLAGSLFGAGKMIAGVKDVKGF